MSNKVSNMLQLYFLELLLHVAALANVNVVALNVNFVTFGAAWPSAAQFFFPM